MARQWHLAEALLASARGWDHLLHQLVSGAHCSAARTRVVQGYRRPLSQGVPFAIGPPLRALLLLPGAGYHRRESRHGDSKERR